MRASDARKSLQEYADSDKAAFFPRFFKTGPGQYGEGDVFIGVTVPQIRIVAKKFQDLPLSELQALLADPVHEYRLLSLIILGDQYKRGDDKARQRIVTFYLANTRYVNNWDLVDSSADKIVGLHCLTANDPSLLFTLARSDDLWEQRIAIVGTFAFIRAVTFEPTFRIADILLLHAHDLIHKAVGWMLREAGKRDQAALENFLKTRYKTMPRTMLRYAIERFAEPKRKQYLRGEQ